MSDKKRIYISIPISGHDINEVREHADLIRARLSRDGYIPVSPFDIYAGKNPTYADHICSDLRALMDCDGIFICKGSRRSCGCNIEASVALNLKIFRKADFQIMYEMPPFTEETLRRGPWDDDVHDGDKDEDTDTGEDEEYEEDPDESRY